MMFALLSLAMYSQAAAVLVRYMPPVKPPAMMVAMLLMWCRGSEWPSTDTVCLGASPSLTQALATVLTCSQYSEKLVSRSHATKAVMSRIMAGSSENLSAV